MAAICPKCEADLFIDGDKWKCRNATCPYQRSIIERLPKYDELLAEVKELRTKYYVLEQKYNKLYNLTSELVIDEELDIEELKQFIYNELK